MTPRTIARMPRRRAGMMFGLVALGLVSLAGCDPRALFFFLQPNEPLTDPMGGPDLTGKRVVVLAHATSTARAQASNIDQDLARKVVSILRDKVKKIEVIEPSKVRDWDAANPSWTDPGDAAKAFEADMTIFLEVEQFETQNPNSPGVFQGRSTVQIQVVEIAHPKDSRGKPVTSKPKEATPGFENECVTEFPTRGPIPMDTGVSRSSFKKKFLDLVANEVTWRFIAHPDADSIQDVSFAK